MRAILFEVLIPCQVQGPRRSGPENPARIFFTCRVSFGCVRPLFGAPPISLSWYCSLSIDLAAVENCCRGEKCKNA